MIWPQNLPNGSPYGQIYSHSKESNPTPHKNWVLSTVVVCKR